MYYDPTGHNAWSTALQNTAKYLPAAGAASAVDGPIPAGEIVSGVVLAGILIYELATYEERHPSPVVSTTTTATVNTAPGISGTADWDAYAGSRTAAPGISAGGDLQVYNGRNTGASTQTTTVGPKVKTTPKVKVKPIAKPKTTLQSKPISAIEAFEIPMSNISDVAFPNHNPTPSGPDPRDMFINFMVTQILASAGDAIIDKNDWKNRLIFEMAMIMPLKPNPYYQPAVAGGPWDDMMRNINWDDFGKAKNAWFIDPSDIRTGVGNPNLTQINGTKIYGKRSYYSGGNKIIEDVEAKSLLAGEQLSLDASRLKTQRNIYSKGIARKDGMIEVTPDGVLIDGHHGARAAAEVDGYVNVIVKNKNIEAGPPILELPVRGEFSIMNAIKKLFKK